MDYTKQIDKLRKFLKKNLSDKRYQHSLRTAQSAIELAKLHPLLKHSLSKVEFAALAHDIAREYQTKKLIELAKKGGLSVSFFERRSPLLIHGKAGVGLLKEDWNISDQAILNAVRFHTIGDPKMDDLAKIVYIADFIEPGRKYHKDWAWLSVQPINLNDILLKVLTESQKYLRKNRKKVHPNTKKLIRKLKKTGGNKKKRGDIHRG